MMKLEDICVSFEYAKKLKEIGIKQESLFMWFEDSSFKGYAGQGLCQEKIFISLEFYKNYFRENAERYSAFTASEFLNMLPQKIIRFVGKNLEKEEIVHDNNIMFEDHHRIIIVRRNDSKEWFIDYYPTEIMRETNIKDIIFHNALSKMIIYLIENKLVSVEEINERI